MSEFEIAFKKIKSLVDEFSSNEPHYMDKHYSEAQARLDFIDKFWIALGWDVNHEQQTNPYKQEVKVEKGIATGGGSQRRADYAFCLAPNYHDVRFLVEAKKPSVDIATNTSCFQLIRYGWSSDTPLAVLTDFEQLHIVDCRYKPNLETALNRTLTKYHYTDYAIQEKFEKIYWLFSREAVADGSIEEYAKTLKKPHGRAIQRGLFPGGFQSIDASFLAELDDYRTTLARTFKNKNPHLDGETLTELSHRTIDRLVFLRFLEDKGIEPQRLVENFGVQGTAWEDFVAASKRLNKIYNGIVYKHHDILDEPSFKVDDTAFADICENISHANSPYDFNAVPIHILGSIYERFLGKVIVTTAKRAKVEEKPEVRKAGGVYYTPEYIVRYIVENTVGKLIEGKTPVQIAKMRFADIACGSGSFLLGVFDLLINYHGRYYNANPKKAKKEDCVKHDGKLYLSLSKKREILLNNIYGVDIDSQAVEVCQLSLYLKLLQEETEASTKQYTLDFEHQTQMKKLLPDLRNNIICGNSLIGRDILDGQMFATEDERKLNPMDFEDAFPEIMKNGGFDAIVGNPPYEVLEKERGAASWPHAILRKQIRNITMYNAALGGKLNLFRFFIVKSLNLIQNSGRLGMIVPLALLADISCYRTRQHLVLSTDDLQVDCFPQKDNSKRRVFPTAKLSTVVLSGIKTSYKELKQGQIFVRVYPWNSFSDPHRKCLVHLHETKLIDPVTTPIPLVDSNTWNLCLRIHSLNDIVRLGEIDDFNVTRGEINQTTFRKFIKTDINMERLLKGVEVGQFILNQKLQQGQREWFDEKQYLQDGKAKTIVKRRRIATQRITGVDEHLRVVATIIDPPVYFADSTNSITISDNSMYRLEYLLALLNSSLIQWRFKLVSTNNNVGTNELKSLPIRMIDFDNSDDKKRHDLMVKHVNDMLEAKKQLASAKSDKNKNFYEKKCSALDRKIDQLVYELYNLTEEEIEIVEKATNPT